MAQYRETSEFYFEVAPQTMKQIIIERCDSELVVRTRFMDELSVIDERKCQYGDVRDLQVQVRDGGVELDIYHSRRSSLFHAAERQWF